MWKISNFNPRRYLLFVEFHMAYSIISLQTNINSESSFNILLGLYSSSLGLTLANYDNYTICISPFQFWNTPKLHLAFTARQRGVITFFQYCSGWEASLELSNATICSCTGLIMVFRPCHWRCITGWKWGKYGKKWWDLDPERTPILLFVFNYGAKFRRNWLRNATVEEWTDIQMWHGDRRGWFYVWVDIITKYLIHKKWGR